MTSLPRSGLILISQLPAVFIDKVSLSVGVAKNAHGDAILGSNRSVFSPPLPSSFRSTRRPKTNKTRMFPQDRHAQLCPVQLAHRYTYRSQNTTIESIIAKSGWFRIKLTWSPVAKPPPIGDISWHERMPGCRIHTIRPNLGPETIRSDLRFL